MIDGDMRVNGKPVTLEEMNEYSGYVQQNDLFHGTLTVREHLTFLVKEKFF
jgi:ABC-type multidrug transport system ATPase subunit